MGFRVSKDLERQILANASHVGPSMLEPRDQPANGEWSEKPVGGIKPMETEAELFAKIAKGKAAARKISGTTIPPVAWKVFKIPQPTPEYRFCDQRRWRVDYAWVDQKVALEIEGGIWQQGRHTRGSGFQRDIDKYNRLALLSWTLIRCTPEQVKDGSIFKTVRQALRLEAFP